MPPQVVPAQALPQPWASEALQKAIHPQTQVGAGDHLCHFGPADISFGGLCSRRRRKQWPSQVQWRPQRPALRTASTCMQGEGGRPPQTWGYTHPPRHLSPMSWSSSEPGGPQSPPASKLPKKPNSPCSPRGWESGSGVRCQGRGNREGCRMTPTGQTVSGHRTLVTPSCPPTPDRVPTLPVHWDVGELMGIRPADGVVERRRQRKWNLDYPPGL